MPKGVYRGAAHPITGPPMFGFTLAKLGGFPPGDRCRNNPGRLLTQWYGLQCNASYLQKPTALSVTITAVSTWRWLLFLRYIAHEAAWREFIKIDALSTGYKK